MRTLVAIAMVTLLLGLVSRPNSALQRSENVMPLNSIHMIDAQNGWATTICDLLSICPGGPTFGLFHTTNGCSTWEDARPTDTSGRRIETLFRYAYADVAWVTSPTEVSGIFRTTNGGRTWKAVTIPAVTGFAGIDAISFINDREGWLLASLGHTLGAEGVAVYRTTDGGDTWTIVASTDSRSSGLAAVGSKTSITFFNSTRGMITVSSSESGKPYFYVTQDGGRTWQQQSLLLPPLQTEQKQPLPSGVVSNWAAGYAPPKVFSAKDGVMESGYARPGRDPSTGIVEYEPVALFYVTHDSGATWKDTSPLLIKQKDCFDRPSDFADVNHGWIAVCKTLYATTNGGYGWATINSADFPVSNQLNFVSPQVGWAMGKVRGQLKAVPPSLFKTVDGGRTWTPVNYAISR